MKNLNSLLTEITKITLDIETNYPGLYKFLDENPITIPTDPHPKIDIKTLTAYLEGLKQQLKNHIENHKK